MFGVICQVLPPQLSLAAIRAELRDQQARPKGNNGESRAESEESGASVPWSLPPSSWLAWWTERHSSRLEEETGGSLLADLGSSEILDGSMSVREEAALALAPLAITTRPVGLLLPPLPLLLTNALGLMGDDPSVACTLLSAVIREVGVRHATSAEVRFSAEQFCVASGSSFDTSGLVAPFSTDLLQMVPTELQPLPSEVMQLLLAVSPHVPEFACFWAESCIHWCTSTGNRLVALRCLLLLHQLIVTSVTLEVVHRYMVCERAFPRAQLCFH